MAPRKNGKMVKRSRFANYTTKKYRNDAKFAPSRFRPTVTLCPDRQYVRLRFSETLKYGLLSIRDDVYRGNCHIDPAISGVPPGICSYGSEQWSTFYGRCYTTSSSIRVKALTTGTNQVSVTVYPSTNFLPSLSASLAAQRPRKRTTMFNSTETKTLSNHATTKAVMGERHNAGMNYSSDTIAQAFPTADWYWHIVAELVAGVASDVVILVELDYHVTFFDRKQILGAIDTSAA